MNCKIKPLTGFAGIAAYNAYLALMLNINLSTFAMELMSDEFLSNAVEKDRLKRAELLYKRYKELPDDSELKKWIFMDLLRIADAETAEYLFLLKIVTDENGIEISDINEDNFTSSELLEMLYKAFLACSNHSENVFF